MNMFEQASRIKLTVATTAGIISFTDLWDLPLQSEVKNKPSLDAIAMDLDSKLGTAGRKSFVDNSSTANPTLQLAFDIVLHIIAVKKAENVEKLHKADKARANARIMEIIASKKDEALAGKSIEELEKLLAV